MVLSKHSQRSEEDRLAALRRTGLLDTPPEQLFDLITTLAAKALHVPVVLMSLVDAERQFFKSQRGLPSPLAERSETPLSHSFCQYVSILGEALVVEDAREHPLVRENLAVRDIGVVAYAGMPLTTEEGYTLGSLCAIDTKPRRWAQDELELLEGFANQIMAEVTLRSRLRDLDKDLGALRASAEQANATTRHIVHDLRTPLNALYLGLDGIAMLGELQDDQRACVALARKNADVLRALVQRLLEFGTPASAASLDARGTCLPHELIDRALDQVTTLAQKAGVFLDSTAVLPMPGVLGRADELTRVLVNLIANGVKFTQRGGEVAVRISEEMESGVRVVRFVVSDTGIGILAEDQRRIFDEGVRVDGAADPLASSGIGLAFCKRAIERHGSHLRVESSPGRGSTFTFSLPIDLGSPGCDSPA